MDDNKAFFTVNMHETGQLHEALRINGEAQIFVPDSRPDDSKNMAENNRKFPFYSK